MVQFGFAGTPEFCKKQLYDHQIYKCFLRRDGTFGPFWPDFESEILIISQLEFSMSCIVGSLSNRLRKYLVNQCVQMNMTSTVGHSIKGCWHASWWNMDGARAVQ